MTPADIRKQLRLTRNQLSLQQQKTNALQAFETFKNFILNHCDSSCKIAFFLSQDAELQTKNCIEYIWQETKHEVYLPVLDTRDGIHMAFARYTDQSVMKKNQFGIEEPEEDYDQHLTGKELDLVFMPLVGFDKDGNRLGMGGGYYDRTFSFKLEDKQIQTPVLIGWAHSCQQVKSLPNEVWDVPLDGIITEKELFKFND